MDRAALQRLLDGQYPDTRARVREWLSRPENAPGDDLERDAYREQVLAWLRDLASEPDTAVGFPAEYGGGDDPGRFVTSFETLAFGDLSLLVKVGVHFGLFGGAIDHLGTEKHHAAYLPRVITAEVPGCFAMTETAHGSNVQALGTTATYDPSAEEFILRTPDPSAQKDYIGNAALHGRMAVVFAQLVVGGEERGVHALLVPLRDEKGRVLDGIWIEDCGAKLGLEGVDNGRIRFDKVRVPRDALLDRYAQVSPEGVYFSPIENAGKRFFTMLGTLVQGRVSIAGAATSASKVALVIAVRYALARRQFGPPGSDEEALLLDYRTHQRRLLIPLAHTYAMHFAQERLVNEFHDVFGAEQGDDRARHALETLAAGVKAVATSHASATIQGCREACGGAGYLRGMRFAALKADCDVFTTFEGDNTVLLQLVAKNLLTDYQDQFGELDPLGTAYFVAGQVIDTVAERTAVREVLNRLADSLLPGRDDEGDLLAHDTQLGLIRWRQEHILSGVARRVKRGIDEGADPFTTLVEVQDHVVEAARAWVDLVVLEAFGAAVERCEDEELREVLGKLCSLHALARIEDARGWYQEHGRLSSPRSKSVLRAVNSLCAELRPHAGDLVEAFGVPEQALGDYALRALAT
jgi:acyl-CoA oxidase